MVRGIAKFREYFAGQDEHYVLIGGAAVDELMGEVGLEFRVTKDLDVVLFLEALDHEFGQVFWEFVTAGGYEHRLKSGDPCFYRFSLRVTRCFLR